MPNTKGNTSSERLFRILFEMLFWLIWIGYPFINANYDDSEAMVFLKMLFWVRVLEVPLFYFNIKYLIPELFRKKGLTTYLITLIIICISYIIFEGKLKVWINPDYKNNFTFFIFFPVLFIAAVSTTYGLLLEMQKQEKINAQERQERMQSELSFLRSQISPHFIFNVLNSIVYLIRSKSTNAENITIKLAELIRYMLYETDDKQVPLSKEIEYLQNYISLQKIRYEDDVDITLKISGTETSQLIEPMLLIPFVENAFKHGVGLVRNPFIHINLGFDNDQLVFEVKNNKAGNLGGDKDSSSGIGLKNVKRRLELLYPNSHLFDIHNGETEFVVNLKLDFKK